MKHFGKTFIEFCAMAILGYLPVWAALLLHTRNLDSYLNSGEAILLSCGLVGPLLYKVYDVDDIFRVKTWSLNIKDIKFFFILLPVLLVCVVAAVIVVLFEYKIQIIIPMFSGFSTFITFSGVFLWFVATWYSRYVEGSGATDAYRDDTDNYLNDYTSKGR